MGRHVPVILALVMLLGCGPQIPATLQTWPGVSADDIVAMDKETYRLVAVRGRSVQTLPDGRLRLELELANLSSLDLDVQIQTQFRDSRGMLLGEPTPYEIVVLPGDGSTLYAVTSLREQPAGFTVQLKIP
jgi:hypothetical protein